MGPESNVRGRPGAWVVGLVVTMALAFGLYAWSLILDRLGQRDVVESASAPERRRGEGDVARRASRSERAPRTPRMRDLSRPVALQRSEGQTQASKEAANAGDTDVVPVEDTAGTVELTLCDLLEESQELMERLDSLLAEPRFDQRTRDEMLLRRADLVEANRAQKELMEASGILCE